ncbi:tetratricopeptide repeat protein [Candidatus Clostridium radicumherbarum]|uniref:Tetratricopeptide repeat protein n=1 Tax=Candidatus Clostridium radicumherbarum TaxID=3381662 RepID=A0ABW8TYU1_9CLOT
MESYFSERLSSVLFLEINKNKLMTLFNVFLEENAYMPIKSSKLIADIKSGNNLNEISINNFLEGMFYVLGIDEKFKYNHIYLDMIVNFNGAISYIKNLVFNEINKENYEDAYIFIKGLVNVEKNEENYEKLIFLAEILREKDKDFTNEELSIITKAKEIENFSIPYLYEALINKDNGDYEAALLSITTYISKGGIKTSEIIELMHSLKSIVNYEEGKSILYEDPDKALKLLIPLLEEYSDNAALFFNIAVGYRILENYEKAIYYLNEALEIDDALVEVVNELGINYASLGDFDKAILYLRKAFEATKSVEICTNLIMCYMDAGDLKQAKNHLEIAKKLDSKDEIVVKLAALLEK